MRQPLPVAAAVVAGSLLTGGYALPSNEVKYDLVSQVETYPVATGANQVSASASLTLFTRGTVPPPVAIGAGNKREVIEYEKTYRSEPARSRWQEIDELYTHLDDVDRHDLVDLIEQAEDDLAFHYGIWVDHNTDEIAFAGIEEIHLSASFTLTVRRQGGEYERRYRSKTERRRFVAPVPSEEIYELFARHRSLLHTLIANDQNLHRFLAGLPPLAAERVALVIGNGAYENPDAVLRNPVNDADGMAAALVRLGFEVVLGKDLDRDGFFGKVGEFARKAHGSEVALFFYAGHGLQVHEKNWLVPVDASFEGLWDLEHRGVKLDTVMDSMRGRHNLVFLDACRNNPLAGELARSMGMSRSEGANRGLARVEKGSGRFIGFATDAGNVADDGAGENSPFTTALLAHIATPGLSVGDMFGLVVQSVVDATGGKQEPWQSSSLRGEPLILAKAAPPPDPKDPGPTTAGGTQPLPATGAAARAYEAAERVGTVAALRVVVEDFPGTTYAKLARVQIARLEAPDPAVAVGGAPDDGKVEPPPPPTPKEVEDGLGLGLEEKRLVQMALASWGHDVGAADGVFGRRTRAGIKAYQGGKGMAETGYLTAEQSEGLQALGARRAEAEHKAREEAERRRRALAPGTKFRDCPHCPEMVVVPWGSLLMGSLSSEELRQDDEGPVHRVTFARPFAVGVYEVTFGEWDACVRGGGCGGYRPRDQGWGRGSRPVIYVSWEDAKAYVRWLSRETGEAYRLLSESEWEYVARAGTQTPFHTGRTISTSQANYDGNYTYGSGRKGQYRQRTTPVGSFSSNAWGLYDVHGNVLEWVEDCWNDSYRGAPSDGSAWTSGECGWRVLRGGSWYVGPRNLRSADRDRHTSDGRYNYLNRLAGFRVARTLTP